MHKIVNYKFFDKYFFRIGVFLLASAPFISIIFFLITLVTSIYKNRIEILNDNYNRVFLLAALGMIIISFIHQYGPVSLNLEKIAWEEFFDINKNKIIDFNRNDYSSFVGLSNWIPLFFCFFGFQKYLNTFKERKLIIKLFIAGSAPVLISGFGQYWFNWHGPLTLLNGLIIWFQKPNTFFVGLFNNQNYTGCWLNIIWPFAIAIFFEKTNVFYKKGASLIFIVSIALASFLTSSRNAWGGLFLTLPILLSTSTFRLFVFINIAILFILIFFLLNLIPEKINIIFNNLFTEKFNIFYQIISDEYLEKDKRTTLILFALRMIIKNPVFGYGAATFPFYYLLKYEVYKGHAHNLIIDLAFNYGIIIAILIFTNVFIICYKSFKKIFISKVKDLSNNYFERAWWTSFFVLLISQMVDVQYYDVRISLAFWLLLTGLKCIITDKKDNMIYTN